MARKSKPLPDVAGTPADSTAVRTAIIDTLRRDLLGPGPEDTDLADEVLPVRPSRWYLTGYLIPADAPEEQRVGTAAGEGDLDSGADGGGLDDAAEPDHPSAKRSFLPSSIGLSFFVPADLPEISVTVHWGDYRRAPAEATEALPEARIPGEAEAGEGDDARPEETATAQAKSVWRRRPRSALLSVPVREDGLQSIELPDSGGLRLVVLRRPASLRMADGERQVGAVSLFLVNHRAPHANPRRSDERFAFQARLAVEADRPFVPRGDPRGLASDDWDERVADLHYADLAEIAVGHNVAADWEDGAEGCTSLWSTWFPTAAVPRVVPAEEVGCTLDMVALGALADAGDARRQLSGLTERYIAWIAAERAKLGNLVASRRRTAGDLLSQAEIAANRIADGIACLADPAILDAFRIANRAIAAAARRKLAQEKGIAPDQVEPLRWRPFQLAFILLNIKGLTEPAHIDRETVDLLFFPTGGGKTEAYLGLAAFVIALRRLRHPGLAGAGLAVLMRYTLRLLTLDQLGRAAAMICALELERLRDPERLGTWPIEIGLWVGRAATPNRLGYKGDNDPESARSRVLRYKNNTKNPQPLPIEQCPWCGTPFGPSSFELRPHADEPVTLDLYCASRDCDFHLSKRPLPLHAVDEPIYRRLPSFMIATVDKFAGLPWLGETANFFGAPDRHDAEGFYGPAAPGQGTRLPARLLPPELIIQDELHLISGPLGTMAGLYETALDALSLRQVGEARVRPKIIASTATVRRAQRQIRALFDRGAVSIFPPPGPDRRDSFFARTLPAGDPGSRLYLGIAAPGGSPKVNFLRGMVSVMSAAQGQWALAAGRDPNPADPYMTVVAYFNALRELGAARRIVEGEIGQRLEKYGGHRRVGETGSRLVDRRIQFEPVELTSRVSTADVARAKRRLASPFADTKGRVDVALATNMISVGLDIVRLGLMVVSGQPKTTAEYIQATSRVGRDPARPGLIVVLLNLNKPRDRSHYEGFKAWHASFYRGVEATSVTPYAPRALDRGLAAVTVAMARLGTPALTPQRAVRDVAALRLGLDPVAATIARRAGDHDERFDVAEKDALTVLVRSRVADLLDEWVRIASEVTNLGYDGRDGHNALLREMLESDPTLPRNRRKFRAPRSLRDVEPNVLVVVQTPDGQDIDQVASP